MNYEVNKESITQKYCENKDKPKMKCHGKCHLNKQIKEQDKQNNQDKNLLKELIQMPSDKTQEAKLGFDFYSESYSPNFFYILRKTSPHATSLFRPPTV